jgi:hypothetical protein
MLMLEGTASILRLYCALNVFHIQACEKPITWSLYLRAEHRYVLGVYWAKLPEKNGRFAVYWEQ